jgi:hypothetical protein
MTNCISLILINPLINQFCLFKVTIVVGRDANRQHLDVSLAAVDAALRSLDRVEAQVPDIDALTVPKGGQMLSLCPKWGHLLGNFKCTL